MAHPKRSPPPDPPINPPPELEVLHEVDKINSHYNVLPRHDAYCEYPKQTYLQEPTIQEEKCLPYPVRECPPISQYPYPLLPDRDPAAYLDMDR